MALTQLTLTQWANAARGPGRVEYINDSTLGNVMYLIAGSPDVLVINLAAFADLADGTVKGGAIDDGTITEPKFLDAAGAGLSNVRYAVATYSFAVDGGGQVAHGLTTEIPANAVILGGAIDVLFNCAGGGGAEIAISVEGANDIVTSSVMGAQWNIGVKDIIPDGTGSTAVKTTVAREITATVSVADLTAGIFVVVLAYVVTL